MKVWATVWNALGYAWDQFYHLMQKIGLGGGVGIVAFLRYMKPPSVNANWVLRALFDAISHVVSNGRSGERTAEDGKTIIWIPPARRQAPKDEPADINGDIHKMPHEEITGDHNHPAD